MVSAKKLRLVRSAALLAEDLNRLTERFPVEEQFLMVPMIKDHALTILENTAIGSAPIDNSIRCKCLTRALSSLGELDSKCTLCKTMNLFTPVDYAALKDSTIELKKNLKNTISVIKQIQFDAKRASL